MKKSKKLFMMLLVCLLMSMAVMPISASAAKLNKKSITLNVGKTYTLKTAGIKGKITWSSNKKSIATVSSKGVVKAVKKGTAVVTAKYGKKKLTCKVTVKQPVTSIKLNKTSVTLKKGNKLTLKATVYPKNANNRAVVWKSSNKKVATVSSKGIVKAVGNGTATITVTAKDGSKKKASCKVNIGKTESQKKRLITKIIFPRKEREMYGVPDNMLKDYGERPEIFSGNFSEPQIFPNDASNQKLLWKSSNQKVAVVNSNGNVTAKSAGTAIITATATDGSGTSASYKVKVIGGIENFMEVDMSKEENIKKYLKKTNRSYNKKMYKYDDWTGEKKEIGTLKAYFLFENPIYSQGWRCIETSKDFAVEIRKTYNYNNESSTDTDIYRWSPYAETVDFDSDISNLQIDIIRAKGKLLFYNVRGGEIAGYTEENITDAEGYKVNPY